MTTTESSSDEAVAQARLETVQRAVKEWVRQLIDLTGRNQLLYYRTLKRGTLELTDAAPGALDVLLSGRTVRLSQLLRATTDEPTLGDDALARARTIHKKALALFEERGIQTLYLAWGMATWTTQTSASTPSAPVLLRPLEFRARGAAEADFDVSLTGDWDVNATLLHLLETEYAVRLDPVSLLDTFEQNDGAAPDPERLFERLCKEADEVAGFGIVPRVVVGTFTYTKLPMVRDLQEAVDALAAHDLIAAIAGDPAARQTVRDLHARDVDASLPDRTPPADEFLILDADASQNFAINAAVAGEPLVIQGPPGTGKSQTIANLITTLTARGKRVLFVAEKRAAIDAVTKRLRHVGLGDLVMDLHGGAKSKKMLAADLAATLHDIARVPAVDTADVQAAVQMAREALNDHAAAMHEVRSPWQLSVWEAQARLLGLPARARSSARFSASSLAELGAEAVRQVRAALEEWADLSAPLRSGQSAWVGANVTTEDQARDAFNTAVELAHQAVPTTRRELDTLLTVTGLPTPANVAAWRRVLDLFSGVAATSSKMLPEIWEHDLDSLVRDLAPAAQGGWARLSARMFNGTYKAALRQATALYSAPGKVKPYALLGLVIAAKEQRTEWTALGGTGAPVLPPSFEAAATSYGHLRNTLAALGAFIVSRDLTQTPHHLLGAEVDALANDQANLFRLPRIHELESFLGRYHCGSLLDGIREGHVQPNDVTAAFDYAWLASIRAHVTASDRRLAGFDGTLQSRRVTQFAGADNLHIEQTPLRVRRRVAECAVAERDRHAAQDDVVVAQSKRKRGHMTLRQLFEAAPDVLTALRPCWVMSPLVVSQTLPAAPVFDVVIFDEASQVTPADAVPALLRAPLAIVAGDDRQLPPTAFFGMASDDGDDDSEEAASTALTTGYESVLDVLSVLLRPYMLQWHYRSEDERLIAFSNHHIYGSALTTFPGASSGHCLSHELVAHRPGVQADTRSNDDEVARVVDLMIEHARTRTDESLGVIAMGIHHADRIEAALRSRIAAEADPNLDAFFDDTREERAFIKNLERVQGDERDAIILTIGYSKAPDGRMLYRFGPLNLEGGERRLNVAASRARKRLTLVSSFSHTDLDPAKLNKKGAQLLRTYLKYVESGGAELDGSDAAAPLNPFEFSVMTQLERAGLKVCPQYGTSRFRIDFAICHPDEPGNMVLAIEADGAAYHSSATARDRDRLRQQMLERLGWRFHRIWSTDWFNNPEAEMEKVLQAYRAALAAEVKRPAKRIAPAGVTQPPMMRTPSERPQAPTMAPKRSTPSPPMVIWPGAPITEYQHHELVALAEWIGSDTLLRTEEQMITEMMRELGYQKRGKRIVTALARAAQDAR